MSADIIRDIMDYLADNGIDTKMLARPQTRQQRFKSGQYIQVSTAGGAGSPDTLNHVDYPQIDITVSMGIGDTADEASAKMAMTVYKITEQACSVTINGTQYLSLHNVTSPVASLNSGRTEYTWTVEAVRFYGED